MRIDEILLEPGPLELLADDALAEPGEQFTITEAAEELSAEWAALVAEAGPALDRMEAEAADQLSELRGNRLELDEATVGLAEASREPEETAIAELSEAVPEGDALLERLEEDFPDPALPRITDEDLDDLDEEDNEFGSGSAP